LTFTGTGTVAQYEAALQSVTFSSSTVGLLARTITFGVTDPGALLPAVSVPVALTVLPALTLPIVTPGGLVVTYTVGNTPAAVGSGLTVTGSSASLTGAVVTIGVKSSGDSLAWTPSVATGAITSTGYDAATGTLTFTGTGTVAQYAAALQSVTFSSSTVGLLARSITFGVTDPGALLPAVSVPVVLTVLPNALPVVTTSVVGNLLYSNNAAAKVVDQFVTITDDSPTLKQAVIKVTGGLLGGNDVLDVILPGGTHLTKVWNATAGTLTLSGSASIAEYQAALQSVTFATSGGVLNLNLGLRTVTFAVTDVQDASTLVPGTVAILVGL
jgi:hypothetical protein